MVDEHPEPEQAEQDPAPQVVLEKEAAPDPVSVYERPEPGVISMPLILGIIAILIVVTTVLFIIL